MMTHLMKTILDIFCLVDLFIAVIAFAMYMNRRTDEDL